MPDTNQYLNLFKEGAAYCSRLLKAIRANGVSSDDSYRMVECSNVRRSNARNDPSAPTETKMSEDCGNHDLVLLQEQALLDEVHSQIVYGPIMGYELSESLGCIDVP